MKYFTLFTFMMFIMVMFISCSKVVEYKVEKEVVINGEVVVYKGFGWSIRTYVIDGHKYIVASSTNGVAICPAKED